ncbi:LysM peptidoglycan-binding domain-containing protein [Emticicia sp. CRIBPO]|uniref:LysM peptidoglycan-binding domain-containing protein n=1 Tax=Emticicia sp. CRIBPO TaxID=2683258 RepID=UPI001412CA5B|nr:LysM peptidoglycan-binding domain-containing protein [Emticicia sp. CRIBPO]NBA86196.1 LysM peptidoglycan-binding domain-containing protein [Emticicia sp. CRIBPO]
MRNIIICLWLTMASFTALAQIQPSIPEAPKKVEFANIIVELSPEAQALVNKEISALLLPQNNYLDLKLERMQLYFPLIEKILKEEDVPEDFKYIAVLESSLLPESISSSNAIGFWQFKEATGKDLGLRVDNRVDERKHVSLSTKAAALYLKKNNLLFKNWVSSMLAHGMGPGGAGDVVPVEWSFANEISFSGNTQRYLIKAIAHRIAYEHRLNRMKDSPRKFVEYYTKGKSLAEIAVELTVDINELRKYNSWLYAPSIPDEKEYLVLVPVRVEDVEDVITKIKKRSDLKSVDVGYPVLKRLTVVSTSPDDPILYEINGKKGILAQPGDEVAQMSEKAGVKIRSFLKNNDMTDKDITREGQIYYLQKKNTKAEIPFHTVRNQQTMWEISQIYGVRLKNLLKYNRMKKDEPLQTGRIVWMQKRRPKSTPVEIIQDAIQERTPIPVRDNYDPVTRAPQPVQERREPEPERPVVSQKPAEIVYEKPAEPVSRPVIEDKKPARTYPSEPANKPVIVEKKPVEEPVLYPKRNDNFPETRIPSAAKKHKVKQGETLFSIAKKYDLTLSEIRKLNNLTPSDVLKYGQTLVVSGVQPYPKETAREEVAEPEPRVAEPRVIEPKASEVRNNATKTHVVGRGETLFGISRKYGVTMKEIMEWNNMTEKSVDAGQKLKINAGGSDSSSDEGSTKASNRPVKHKVERGDTLYSISKKYGVTMNEIKELNDLQSGNVQLGNVLIIRK